MLGMTNALVTSYNMRDSKNSLVSGMTSFPSLSSLTPTKPCPLLLKLALLLAGGTFS